MAENNEFNQNTQNEEKSQQGHASESDYIFWAEQAANQQAARVEWNQDGTYRGYQEKQAEYYQEPSNQKTTRKSGFFATSAKVVSAAVIFGLVAGGTFIGTNEIYTRINPDSATSDVISGLIGETDNAILTSNSNSTVIGSTTVSQGSYVETTDVTDVVDKVMPATVAITSTFETQSWYGTYTEDGGGTGIIVRQTDDELLIVTNNHVIEDAVNVSVTFNDGTSVAATVKGTDSSADLAVLSIDLSDLTEDTLNSISIATLGDSDSVKVGEMVVAIGNALGYGQSVTVGYVSAKDREVTVDDNTMTLLQTDAAINPGNSGGALINTSGEVIGINSVKYSSDEVEGMGFAIPISNVTDILEELMNRETLADDEKGYLGVYITDVTEDVATFYNWPVGVYVKEFTESGNAEEAGIQIGDIITGINGETLTNSADLIEKVTSYRYGTTITVTLQRLVDDAFVEMNIDIVLTPHAATAE